MLLLRAGVERLKLTIKLQNLPTSFLQLFLHVNNYAGLSYLYVFDSW